jgi:hypothetical protein
VQFAWETRVQPIASGHQQISTPANDRKEKRDIMKKIAATLGAVSIAGLALAPLASAEQAPPITEGPHTFYWSDGGQSAVTVAYDCGPDCFTMGDDSTRDQFHFDGTRWVTPEGISTPDGHNYVNKNGIPATVT